MRSLRWVGQSVVLVSRGGAGRRSSFSGRPTGGSARRCRSCRAGTRRAGTRRAETAALRVVSARGGARRAAAAVRTARMHVRFRNGLQPSKAWFHGGDPLLRSRGAPSQTISGAGAENQPPPTPSTVIANKLTRGLALAPWLLTEFSHPSRVSLPRSPRVNLSLFALLRGA